MSHLVKQGSPTIDRTIAKGAANQSGRADGNRKQRGFRALTAKSVGRLLES